MAIRPFSIFLFTMVSVWKFSKGVETLTCSSSSPIQIGPTTTTFQFGDGSTTYNTLLSCTWTFTASDSSASLVIGQRLKCGDGDELSLRDGGGGPTTISCCVDCTKTPKVTGPTATIGFTSDGTRNPNDIGFYLDIFAGKDESGCSNQNNTFNVSISSPYVITSPNFPSYYPINIECHYTFIPEPLSQRLVISFQFINLDYDSGCYDKIILKEGDVNGNKIAEICKDYGQYNPVLSPNETYRTTGSLFLQFISESQIQARGFRAIVQQDSTSGNTESTTTVITESTTTENNIQTTTAELTTVSTTNSESSTSQGPTSKNTKSTTTVVTESTTTESTTQSTTVSTTNSESTTSKSITSGNTLTIVTTENTSPTPTVTESTTLQTTLESTTTENTTTSSSTTKSPTSSTPKSQESPESTALTRQVSSTTFESTTSTQQPPSTTQKNTASTQHLSTLESSTTSENPSSTQQLSSTTVEHRVSTQNLSTLESSTTLGSTASSQQLPSTTVESSTSSQQHSSTLVTETSTSIKYSTTPRQPTTNIATTTGLSYLERLGFTPTTFAAMTTGVSFLVLVTLCVFVLLVYTIRRKSKFKHKIKKKHKQEETYIKRTRGNMYDNGSFPLAFHQKYRRPFFYDYW